MTQPAGDRFIAVGDIMLGDSATCVGFGFHSRYRSDATPALAGVSSFLSRGDIVYGNLECLLSPDGLGRTRYRADQMRGDPSYARALRAAGFTALGVANNHAMQHGLAAFEQTVRHLRDAGIAVVGLRGNNEWCAEPVTLRTRSDMRVGILGYSWRPRQYDQSVPLYAEGDAEAVARDVARLRATVDSVVVSLHWGEEFLETPSVAEQDAARRILDAGATVIVGHHPHVVRPVEQRGDGIIAYSLGNFVTDMLWMPELRTGALLECTLSGDRAHDARVARVRIDDEFRPSLETAQPVSTDAVVTLDESVYRVEVARTVNRQRMAAYRYTFTNALRFPAPVLAELVATTVLNKATALTSRVARAGRGSARG